VLLLGAMLGACRSDADLDSDVADTGGSDTTTHAACAASEFYACCWLSAICHVDVLACGPENAWEASGGYDCAFSALRDGLPGRISVEYSCSETQWLDEINVLGNGKAVLVHWEGGVPAHGLYDVRPQTFFSDCLNTRVGGEIVQCLRDWYITTVNEVDLCCPSPIPGDLPPCGT